MTVGYSITNIIITLSVFLSTFSHVDPCHHDMGRPRVANEGDGLQMWRVAVNILNKQSRIADKG